MVRSEIVAKLTKKIHHKLRKSEIEKIIKIILDSIVAGIIQNKATEWRGFGSLSPKKIKEKFNARNPRSGKKIYIPAQISIAFKMAKELKNKINQNKSYTN
jgi:nucleoid DNA-binding protein